MKKFRWHKLLKDNLNLFFILSKEVSSTRKTGKNQSYFQRGVFDFFLRALHLFFMCVISDKIHGKKLFSPVLLQVFSDLARAYYFLPTYFFLTGIKRENWSFFSWETFRASRPKKPLVLMIGKLDRLKAAGSYLRILLKIKKIYAT